MTPAGVQKCPRESQELCNDPADTSSLEGARGTCLCRPKGAGKASWRERKLLSSVAAPREPVTADRPGQAQATEVTQLLPRVAPSSKANVTLPSLADSLVNSRSGARTPPVTTEPVPAHSRCLVSDKGCQDPCGHGDALTGRKAVLLDFKWTALYPRGLALGRERRKLASNKNYYKVPPTCHAQACVLHVRPGVPKTCAWLPSMPCPSP